MNQAIHLRHNLGQGELRDLRNSLSQARAANDLIVGDALAQASVERAHVAAGVRHRQNKWAFPSLIGVVIVTAIVLML